MPDEDANAEFVRDAHDVRVLRRVALPGGELVPGGAAAPHVGMVVDVETTGCLADDPVIEIGLRRFRYDDEGRVTAIGAPRSWLQDPCVPIPPEVTRLTGIGDADVAGRVIDVAAVGRMIAGAQIVVAHNAGFDRPRVAALIPAAAEACWACTLTEVDWSARGFEGRKLGHLVMEAGWFHNGHRALADVDAVLQLLIHRFPDGVTVLGDLLARASQPSWLISARGAHFDVKDLLKARGYRWNGERRVWWREVCDADREAEEWWLARNVYAGHARATAAGPEMVGRDWRTRHG